MKNILSFLGFSAALCLISPLPAWGAQSEPDIINGVVRPDTRGIHINSHGGCIVPWEGNFYWFGESRTGHHSDGISVYKSPDLITWDFLGMAAVHQGERDDENFQDISEGRLLERPKVAYNPATGKWVMWAHWENGKDYTKARVAILEADSIEGPYRFIRTIRPNGHDSRDMTLFADLDGNAYHFCSTNMNTDINVAKLAPDWLDVSKDETLIMKGDRLEATTVCRHGDLYFATFSECKGWDPAPGHTSMAYGDPLGEWTEGLSFCVDPDADRSYGSQGAYVVSLESLGYDPKCFLWMGDRWNPKDVGNSTYVWLPMSIRSGYPAIRNFSSWNLDDRMREMYRYKRAANLENGMEISLLERSSNRMMSQAPKPGFFIDDDENGTNVTWILESTSHPDIYRLRDRANGRYLVSGKKGLGLGKASKNAEWMFRLLPDGYYNIVNVADGMTLTLGAENRYAGTEIVVAPRGDSRSQAFGVYYDSKAHSYGEADMWSKEYYDTMRRKSEAQTLK